ncbi:LysM peptidoglycan-binding domain-containing protein [Bacillus sp. T3]|uniref:LysM peptidoglycan-binding domain-containing protein n=1 Tax=Bacillus sp. T3 TaxID=467262 RepID=UPI0029814F20|nr:LysM peptidoglycan-binding domain-containing protein [Bacillus sp. T3]
MKVDFDIEIAGDAVKQDKNVQLPQNFVLVGNVENDDVKIYIKQNVYKKIEKFAKSDISKELGSILIGQSSEELGKTHVIISDFIEAKFTDASASTLTFTHETWDYIYRQKTELYPQGKILGWQHTHPSYGIFLSNYDLFIQQNFFNLPFQVAYVVDPVTNTRGFFGWKNDKIEKINGYYVYDEVGKTVSVPDNEKANSDNKNATLKSKMYVIPMILLLCATIGWGVFFFSISNRYNSLLKTQEKIVIEMDKQKRTLENKNDIIEKQEKNIFDMNGKLDKLENDKSRIDEFENAVIFNKYIVKPGDSLISICNENKVDFESKIRIIQNINGINNSNMIYDGQTILLPIN